MRILQVAPLVPLREKPLVTHTVLVVTSFLLIGLIAGGTVFPAVNALHPPETIMRVEYANNCAPDASIDPYLCDATLSDLSQTKVTDALAPDSAIGTAAGGTVVSTDPLIKFRDGQFVDNVWLPGPGPSGQAANQGASSTECVFRDNDDNSIFSSATDTVIFAGSGAGACTGTAAIKSDPKIKFLDTTPVNSMRDATERVFYDFNDNGVIEIGTAIVFFTDIVLYGAVDVFAWQVLVRYDPSIFNVRLFNIGPLWTDSGGSGFPSIDNVAGTAGFGATLTATTSAVTNPGPISLVRINWRVMNEGASNIHLVTDVEDVSFGFQLLDSETPTRNILYDTEDGFVSTTNAISLLPNPEFTFAPPNPVSLGSPVDFDASTGSTDVATFAWDFGDGTTGVGGTLSHSFANACDPALRPRPIGSGGCYRVFLRGTNPAGIATSSKIVIVQVVTQPLVVTVTCPDAGLTAGKPFICDVSVTGGTPPYTGTGPQQASFPAKGTYTVSFTVTDSAANSESGSDTVTIAAQPLAVSVVCTDGTAGKPISCDVSASGGTSPYTGAGTFSPTFAVKGSYTVSFDVTDSNGVTVTGSDSVSIAAQPLVVSVVCSDGSAGKPVDCNVSATGGTAPYTGTGTFSRTFAVKGTYDVSFDVTDSNGATATGSDSVVIAPQPLVVTVVCSDGTAGKPITCDVSASGGTGPYTGTGTFTETFPVKGTYTVSFDVTDSNGDTATGSDSVAIAAQPVVVSVDCPGVGLTAGKPFTCEVSATGGTSPYSGTGSQLVSFPVKGTYDVTFTVTDANGASATGQDSVVIASQPLTVTVVCPDTGLSAGKPFTCDVSATDGTSPYIGTGSQTVVFPVKGTYTLTFTVTDANDESASGSDSVIISAQPLVATAACPDSGLTEDKPFDCEVSATGGTTPYTGTGIFSQTFTEPGTYTVTFTVTDANGASTTASDTVAIAAQPPGELIVTVTCPATGLTAGKPFQCDVSATGGTPPYSGTGPQTASFPTKGTHTVSFTVTDSADVSATGSDTVTIDAQPLVVTVACPDTGLTAGKPFTCDVSATGGTSPYSGTGSQSATLPVKGTYDVTFTVTDANGASASGSDSVLIEPQPPVVTVVCPDSDLTAGKPFTCDVSATGGTAPYAGTGSFTQTFAEPGTYTVSFTVTDANDDSASGSDTVEIAPQPPGELVITVTCPDSGLTAGKPFQCDVSAAGGTPPYTGTGSQPVSFPVKGTYTVTFTVTDSADVSATGSDTVIIAAQPLIVTVACPDAGLTAGKPFMCTVDATGGTGPYTGTGDLATTLPTKGTHTVTFAVTDANGESASGSDTVTIAPQPITATVTCPTELVTAGKPFSCDVSVTGGTIPYQFQWIVDSQPLGGETDSSVTLVFPVKGEHSISVRVTDLNNDAVESSPVVVDILPQQLFADFEFSPLSPVVDQAVTFTAEASGGTAPYQFDWNFGDGSTSTGIEVIHAYSSSGAFQVHLTVTDANGATVTADLEVVVSEVGQPLTGDFTFTAATSGKPVSFTASASGGTPPYGFEWDFGDGGSGTGSSVSHSYAVKGSYDVTLTILDSAEGLFETTHTVTVDPQPLTADFTVPTVTAGKPVTLTSILSGGTSPYIVHWDLDADGTFDHTGEEFTVTFTVKGTAMVRLHIIDDNGSDAEVTHEITVDPQPLVVSVECPFALTAGKPFFCSVTATGGTAPYSGTGLRETTYSVKGTYTLSFTVTDANGETATGSTTITIDPQPLVADFEFAPEGEIGEPLAFEAFASGGTAPYSFSWDFGDGSFGTSSTVSHAFAVKGSYFVVLTVTDANGATAQVQHVVVVLPQILIAAFSASSSPGTVGEPVTFTATVNGGTLPYVYEWSFGDGGTGTGNPASHTYASAGQVTVLLVATDANDAVAAASLELTIEPSAVAAVLLTFDGCDVDSFEDGVGELNVFINGVPVVDIPAGLHGLTGSGEYVPYDGVCVNFGPFDITSHIQQGANTLVFLNPLDSHFSQIKNIRVFQDGTVLLFDTRIRSNGPGDPEVLTFSVPPLVLTSFGLVQPAAFETERVTFTAIFTGGTAPFRCTFSFGDGDSKTVSTNTHECSASHTYWSDRLRTATVRVRGSTLADNVQAQMLVRVEPQPGCAEDNDDDGDDDGDNGDDCLSWRNIIDFGEEQTFRVRLTNPASVSVLIRLDFTVTRPDGSKESFISPSFLLSPGQTLTDLSFNYVPSGGMGKYCFKAPLRYGVDTNDNGVLEDSERLGNRLAESGCFTVVSVAALTAPPALFLGAMLIPKSRNSIIRFLRPKKHE